MGIKLKKNVKGSARRHWSRAKCLNKLQLSLKDFNKLCILKGVFPREPPKSKGKLRQQYYHTTDIAQLTQDANLDTIRLSKVHRKKVTKAIGRCELSKLPKLRRLAPRIDFKQTLEARYATFVDALRDMDDALSTVAMVSVMRGARHGPFAGLADKARAFEANWGAFLSNTKFVKKAFISVKGFYVQICLWDMQLVWLIPHRFAALPSGPVDMKVIETFAQLHCALAQSVLNRLLEFAESPTSGHCLQERTLSQFRCGNPSNNWPLNFPFAQKENVSDLFANVIIRVNREVPFYPTMFLLRSCGAVAAHESELQCPPSLDPRWTHWVVDKPMDLVPLPATVDVVTPQWVFDSLNASQTCPCQLYHPTAVLPPHLSPFVVPSQDASSPDYPTDDAATVDTSTGTFDDTEDDHAKDHSNGHASTLHIERQKVAMSKKRRHLYESIMKKQKLVEADKQRLVDRRIKRRPKTLNG